MNEVRARSWVMRWTTMSSRAPRPWTATAGAGRGTGFASSRDGPASRNTSAGTAAIPSASPILRGRENYRHRSSGRPAGAACPVADCATRRVPGTARDRGQGWGPSLARVRVRHVPGVETVGAVIVDDQRHRSGLNAALITTLAAGRLGQQAPRRDEVTRAERIGRRAGFLIGHRFPGGEPYHRQAHPCCSELHTMTRRQLVRRCTP